jgi:hypothetical protein
VRRPSKPNITNQRKAMGPWHLCESAWMPLRWSTMS